MEVNRCLEITIPDPLIDRAERAAAASGLSPDPYLADALGLRLQDDPEEDKARFITPERITEIKEAQAEARTGNHVCVDRFRAEAKLPDQVFGASEFIAMTPS